jgi:acetyl-CoA acetyltransferase
MGGQPVIAAPYELPPGRYRDVSVEDMHTRAALGALARAGLTPSEVDGVLASPAEAGTDGEYGSETLVFMHERLYEELGIRPRFADTFYAGGATHALMVQRAAMAIRAGAAETVLCVSAGKFPTVSRGGGASMARMVSHPEFEYVYGAYIPAIFALAARRYMHRFGVDESDLAGVAVSARRWALLHPEAVAHDDGELTVEDVLSSRPVASPFRLLDCSRPCEGGGALLVTTAERARSWGVPGAAVLGCGEFHSHGYISQVPDLEDNGTAVAARQAFSSARMSPEDIGIVEVYDAFSSNPIVCYEDAGLCPRGDAAALFAAGETGPGGSRPTNTNGGLLSFGHTGRSAGMSVVIEGALQAMGAAGERQVDAENVFVHTFGGMMAEHATLILGASA